MADFKRSQVLTELAIGYKNPEFVGEVLFPIVEVTVDKVLVPKGGADYMVLVDTERAEGAASNRLLRSKDSSITVNLVEHDCEVPIDWRKKGLIKNEDGGFRSEDEVRVLAEKTAAAQIAANVVALSREYKCALLAQNPDLYPANNKLIIESDDDRFDDPDSDPIAVFQQGRTALMKSAGIEPNVIVTDYATYSALINHAKVKSLLGDNERRIVTRQILAELLGVQTFAVGKAKVKDFRTGNLVDLWGHNLVMAYIPPRQNRSLYEPNFGFTIRDMRPTSTYADEYDEPRAKTAIVRYTETREVVLADATAGFLVAGTVKETI